MGRTPGPQVSKRCPIDGKQIGPMSLYLLSLRTYCSRQCKDVATRGPRAPSHEAVVALRAAFPDATLAALGKKVGLARERVRQILKRAGLKTSTHKKHYCRWCGKPMKSGRQSCSEKCRAARAAHRYQSLRITVLCETCGKGTQRRRRHVTHAETQRGYQHTWCNKVCQGKWLGTNHGQARQTHCKRGHDLSDAYTWVRPGGVAQRTCRQCSRDYYAAKRRER